eukprot:scaffold15108_cov180-Amphora_coffeaeformis.AAC.60
MLNPSGQFYVKSENTTSRKEKANVLLALGACLIGVLWTMPNKAKILSHGMYRTIYIQQILRSMKKRENAMMMTSVGSMPCSPRTTVAWVKLDCAPMTQWWYRPPKLLALPTFSGKE